MRRYSFILLVRGPVLGLIFLSMMSMGLAAAGSRWVTAEKGLRLREAPSESARIVILIPHRSEVAFLEEQNREVTIGGTKGKWMKISWEGRTGWAFGGFLAALPPAGKAADGLVDGEWWELTSVKGKDVIYRPCFAETRSIRVNMADKSIAVSLGQEQISLHIVKATRSADGAMAITLRTEPGDQPYTATMRLARGGKVAVWKNIDGMGTERRYVEGRHLSEYKTVLENDGECGEP